MIWRLLLAEVGVDKCSGITVVLDYEYWPAGSTVLAVDCDTTDYIMSSESLFLEGHLGVRKRGQSQPVDLFSKEMVAWPGLVRSGPNQVYCDQSGNKQAPIHNFVM